MRITICASVEGLDPTGALDAFESLLKAAGKAAEPTEAWRSDTGVNLALDRSLKAAMDPHHVLGGCVRGQG